MDCRAKNAKGDWGKWCPYFFKAHSYRYVSMRELTTQIWKMLFLASNRHSYRYALIQELATQIWRMVCLCFNTHSYRYASIQELIPACFDTRAHAGMLRYKNSYRYASIQELIPGCFDTRTHTGMLRYKNSPPSLRAHLKEHIAGLVVRRQTTAREILGSVPFRVMPLTPNLTFQYFPHARPH